jgi:CBS domain-containing protein
VKTAKDILAAKGSEIWTIKPGATISKALQIMQEKEVGALVVLDQGKPVGIVSERDYARKVLLAGKPPKSTKIKEIMTQQLLGVRPHTTVDECMMLMTTQRVRHLPVLDGEKLVGIVSIGDLVKSIIDEQKDVIEDLKNYIVGKYT